MGLLFFISAQDVVVIPPDPGGEVVVVSISSVYDIDPYLDQTVLLLHGDSLIDECGKVITVNGNVSVSSVQKKFGTGSLYFDGNGDYLTIPVSNDFAFGTGDFTLECWVSSTVINAGNGIFRITDAYLKQDQTGIGLAMQGPNQLQLYHNGYTNSASLAWTTNTWYHVAVVKTGGYIKVYWNGTPVISVVDSSNFTGTYMTIGAHYSTAHLFTGYIDNVRITKGVARYTNSFAVPSKAFPDYQYSDPEWDSTILLLRGEGYNGSTNIKDDTGNNVVVHGNTKISTTQKKYGNSSLYFDGASDGLSVYNNFELGTKDFTIEFWMYSTTTAFGRIVGTFQWNGGSQGGWTIYSYNNYIGIGIYAELSNSGANSVPSNVWNHVVLVRKSGIFYWYINGTLTSTGSSYPTTSLIQPTTHGTRLIIGGKVTDGGAIDDCYTGYLDDIRIYKNYAKYAANFTPVQQTLPSVFPTYEQYADSTVLLINGNGVNNSTNITDATGKTITVNGNTRISTTQSKFNGSSIYFDGTGDYLTLNDTSLALGTDDFTVEGWFNIASITSNYAIMDFRPASTNGAYLYIFHNTSGQLVLYVNTANRIAVASGITVNTWNHIALVRNAGVSKFYVNGVGLSTTWADTTNYLCPSNRPVIGADGTTLGSNLNGYMQDIRITKGIARYTANFTPPTESFKYITNQPTIPYYDYYYDNVSLLLKGTSSGLANNKFIDNSVNNYTITTTGTTSQGLIGPNSNYNGVTISSGSYLSAAVNSNFTFGTGNFTIEFWLYLDTVGGSYQDIMLQNVGNGLQVMFIPGNKLRYNLAYVGALLDTTISLSAKTWYHIALVRSSNTVKWYINGVLDSSVNNTTNWTPTTPIQIGGSINYYTNITISNLHITKSAKYTTDFTPSTTPVTTDANTVLLLNFDQAGIIDSTRKCNIATFGDAKVNNKTKHYTNSVYFDGNGDYLTIPASTDFNFGTGDYTIECWIWWDGTYSSNGRFICGTGGSGSVDQFIILNPTVGGSGLGGMGLGWGVITYYPPTNVWTHVAVTRSNGTVRLFGDGLLKGSVSYTTAIGSSSNPMYIGRRSDGSHNWLGYIQDLRITKGIARYTADFTPPYLDYATNRFDSYDPHWTKNVLLIHGEGTNDSTNITDVTGKAITVVGNTKISTTQSKFGNGSIAFDGNGDYLTIPSNSSLLLNGVDFTIECWIYPTRAAGSGGGAEGGTLLPIITQGEGAWYNNNWQGNFTININSSGLLCTALAGAGTVSYQKPISLTVNTWQHIAVVRVGSTITAFLNGNSLGSQSGCTDFGNSLSWTTNIGLVYAGDAKIVNYFQGYMQDLRITKGIAKYTKNFAPLQSRIPNPISNFDPYYDNITLLLKGEGDNNSTTIIDQKGHTITANNGALISTTQSKFGTSSIYFDGTNDYLSIPSSTDFDFGSNNFTIECWLYREPSTYATIVSQRTSAIASGIYWNYNNLSIGNGSSWVVSTNYSSTPATNIWNHYALVRNGTSISVYINGISVLTATIGTNTIPNNLPFFIGQDRGNAGSGYTPWKGYIDDFRITKGIARYTGNFPVPVNTYPTYYPESYLAVTSPTSTSVIKNGSLLFENTSGTFECWLNISNLSGADGYSRIYNEIRHATIGGGGSIHIVNSTKKIGIYLESPDSTNFAYYSTQTITLNVWNHIVVTWATDKTLKIYINGVLDSTQTMAVNRHTGTAIIQSSIGAANNFNGTVQNLQNMRLYNTTIDETKVTTLYNNGNVLYVTPDTGLVAGYNFNSNTNNIHDASNNGNDFVLGSGCVIQPYNI